jgi:hypothetical protein
MPSITSTGAAWSASVAIHPADALKADRCVVCDRPLAEVFEEEAVVEPASDRFCWPATQERFSGVNLAPKTTARDRFCKPVDWRTRALLAELCRP